MENQIAEDVLDKLISHENAWPWQDELRGFKSRGLNLEGLSREVEGFFEKKIKSSAPKTPMHNFAIQLLGLFRESVPDSKNKNKPLRLTLSNKSKKRPVIRTNDCDTNDVEFPSRKRIKRSAARAAKPIIVKTNWVQCDRCSKWRRVLREISEHECWTCDMNIYFDPQRASCDVPEENWSTENVVSSEDVVYSEQVEPDIDDEYVPSRSKTKTVNRRQKQNKITAISTSKTTTTTKVPKLKIKIRGPKTKEKKADTEKNTLAESKRQLAVAKLKRLGKLKTNTKEKNQVNTSSITTTTRTLKRRGGTKTFNTNMNDDILVPSTKTTQMKRKRRKIPCILLIGPPGAGKGTQGNLLAEKLEWTHISCGDLFRKARDSSNELGVQIRKMLASKDHDGEYAARVLAIDQMLQQITKDCVEPDSICQGVVLDGCRSVEQARSMEASLRTQGLSISLILVFELASSLIESRCAGRLVHLASGRVYHRDQNPPMVDGLDDLTGEPLVTRREDSLNVVIERRELFQKTRESVCEYFKSKGAIVESVEASESVSLVHSNILLIIQKALKRKKQIFAPIQRWLDDISYMKDNRYSKNNTEGAICLLCESGVANRLKDLLRNTYVWNLRRDKTPPSIGNDRVLREAADCNEYRGVITRLDSSGGCISCESGVLTFISSASRTTFSNLKIGTKVSFNIGENERAVNILTERDSVFASLSEYASERDSTLEWSCVISQVTAEEEDSVRLPLGHFDEEENKERTTMARALRNLRERLGIWLDPEICTRQYQGWLRSNLRQVGRLGLTKDMIPLYRDTISRPEVRVYYILLPLSESLLLSPFSSSDENRQDVRVTFLKSVPDASKRFKFAPESSSSSSSSAKYMRPRKRRIEIKKKNKKITSNTETKIPGAIWTDTVDSSGIPIYRNDKTGESVVKTLPQPWHTKGWTLMMNRKATMLYWWNRNTNQSVWRSGENSTRPPGV